VGDFYNHPKCLFGHAEVLGTFGGPYFRFLTHTGLGDLQSAAFNPLIGFQAAAPRTASIMDAASVGVLSPRQATCPSGRTSTSRRS
jgi:hypothetical protein